MPFKDMVAECRHRIGYLYFFGFCEIVALENAVIDFKESMVADRTLFGLGKVEHRAGTKLILVRFKVKFNTAAAASIIMSLGAESIGAFPIMAYFSPST